MCDVKHRKNTLGTYTDERDVSNSENNVSRTSPCTDDVDGDRHDDGDNEGNRADIEDNDTRDMDYNPKPLKKRKYVHHTRPKRTASVS